MADSTNPANSGGGEAPTAPGGPEDARDPRAGGAGNLPSTGAPAATPPTAQGQTPAQPAESGPFEDEALVMNQGVAMRDDISETQTAPAATRDISSTHIARLLYRPIDTPGGPVYQSQIMERRNRRQG